MKTNSFLLVAAITLVTGGDLAAQEHHTAPRESRWEFLLPSGTVVPTGVQRDVIKRANLSAAQLSFLVNPMFAVTSTVGWARSRDAAAAGNPKLDVFTYDVGVEARGPRLIDGPAVAFRSFIGAGAGGRSYNYRSLEVDATHNLGGYASIGGDLEIRRVGVRLEARDYVTGFKPLAGSGAAHTGNDIVVLVGLRLISR